MPTGTAATNARVYPTQQVHYLYKDLIFSQDALVQTMGTLPAGAIVLACKVAVTTLFNDTGTDLVNVGTVADPDGYAASVDVSTVGVKLSTTMATSDDFFPVVDTVVVASYDGANSDMTTGACTVVLEYIVKQ